MFNHNFLEDNESIRRLFYQTFNIIHYERREMKYQLEAKKIAKEVQGNVEKAKLSHTYHEYSIQQMLKFIADLFNKGQDRTKFVQAYRTTGVISFIL